MTLIDINNDGKNEVVAGCDNGVIQIYQNDTLLFELFENSNVVNISTIGKCFHLEQKAFLDFIHSALQKRPAFLRIFSRTERSEFIMKTFVCGESR